METMTSISRINEMTFSFLRVDKSFDKRLEQLVLRLDYKF
jgi:hypothetical protein